MGSSAFMSTFTANDMNGNPITFEISDKQARADINKLTEEFETIYVKPALIPDKKIRSYTYDDMVADIEKLEEEFENDELFRVNIIGSSVQGLSLYALEYGSSNATKHLFVFNGFHAKDTSASIALSQLETLIRNPYYEGLNIREKILAIDTCVHVIPMANPDGFMLGHENGGFEYFSQKELGVSETRQNNIKLWVTDYIKNKLKTDSSEPGSSWTREELDDLETYITSLNGNPSESYDAYVFRDKDLKVFAGNINGIDLHYNWYTDAMRPTVEIACASHCNGFVDGYVYGAYGSEPYLDENSYYKAYIDSFNPNASGVHMSFLNYHQKGPTIIWNYRLHEIGDADTSGFLINRSYDVGKSLALLTSMPFSEKASTQSIPVGFTGWVTRYIPERYTLSYTMEIGWNTDIIRGDGYSDTTNENAIITRSPVPDDQWTDIYESQKNVFLHMVRHYTSCRDISDRHQGLNENNIRDNIEDDVRFGVPSMELLRQSAWNTGYCPNISTFGVSTLTDLLKVLEKTDADGNEYVRPLRCKVMTNDAIVADLPSWSFSTNGCLTIMPMRSDSCCIEFNPYFTPLLYRTYAWKLDVNNGDWIILDWENVTPCLSEPSNYGANLTMTLAEICDLIPKNHSLRFFAGPSWEMTDLPEAITSRYLYVTLNGYDSTVDVCLKHHTSLAEYHAYYSRSQKTILGWKTLTLTTL